MMVGVGGGGGCWVVHWHCGGVEGGGGGHMHPVGGLWLVPVLRLGVVGEAWVGHAQGLAVLPMVILVGVVVGVPVGWLLGLPELGPVGGVVKVAEDIVDEVGVVVVCWLGLAVSAAVGGVGLGAGLVMVPTVVTVSTQFLLGPGLQVLLQLQAAAQLLHQGAEGRRWIMTSGVTDQ